jgi:hypothetical protein
VLLVAASILAARKLANYDADRRVPATISLKIRRSAAQGLGTGDCPCLDDTTIPFPGCQVENTRLFAPHVRAMCQHRSFWTEQVSNNISRTSQSSGLLHRRFCWN